jgi:putative ABC transport system permease protein
MFRRLRYFYEYLLRRRRFEDELDEELRSSFDLVVDRFVAQGMSLPEARRAAQIEFEGMEHVKENVRDQMAGSGLSAFLQDVRYGWRALRRYKSFAWVSLVTLALGIGVNTAIFSVFYGVLLHPLPYDHPERLVRIWAPFRNARGPLSGPMFAELERRNRSFASIAGIWVVEPRTFIGDNPEQLKTVRVTTNFFDVLGVHPAQGRAFSKEDGGSRSVMLTDGVFRRRFAANPELIGKGLPTQDGVSGLLGVLPREFRLQFAPDVNIPSDLEVFDSFGPNLTRMGGRFLRIVGRLRPGVTLADAQHDLERLAVEIRTDLSLPDTNFQLKLAGLQADAFGDVEPALKALFAGAAFVLLICFVNVSSLLLARAGDRRKEIALRLSLGASRGRILRQLFAEGLLLCVLGGAGGVAIGWAGFQGLLAIRPERLARIADARLSWPVVAFAAAASLTAAILFALVPAFESFRLDLMTTLRASGRGWLGRVHRRAGGCLVVGEVALGFVLVTAAALMAQTLARIQQVRPGFEPRQLLTFQLPVGYSPADRRAVTGWEEELATIPGVERVGAISHLPLDGDLPNWFGPYRPEGSTEKETAAFITDYRSITPGYLAAMGARLIEGRYFDHQDRENGRQVLIIDEYVARSTWPGQSAIGRTIGIQGTDRVVVGLVEHVRNHSLTDDVRGVVYMPLEQSPRSPLTFVLRTSTDPLSVVTAVRQKLRQRHPDAAIGKIRPMTGYVDRAIAPSGFTAALAAIFGSLALLLAATGIYGVFNYQISRRLPEMGIRMAMGARAGDVLRLVLREGFTLIAVGVLIGAVGALVAARWLSGLVYGVSARDPLSYGFALLVLPAAGLLGCWHPAARAAAANPAGIIRDE